MSWAAATRYPCATMRKAHLLMATMVTALALVGGVSCTSPDGTTTAGPAEDATTAKADRLEQLFSGDMTVLDLTHALSPNSVYWPDPSGNPFKYEVRSTQPSGAVSMRRFISATTSRALMT